MTNGLWQGHVLLILKADSIYNPEYLSGWFWIGVFPVKLGRLCLKSTQDTITTVSLRHACFCFQTILPCRGYAAQARPGAVRQALKIVGVEGRKRNTCYSGKLMVILLAERPGTTRDWDEKMQAMAATAV